jgi:sulfide:quinone oxidoreductase
VADRTVLILGGGTGGLVAARRLRAHLGDEHRVVLIDRQPSHHYPPSYLWVMTGARRPEQVTRDLRRVRRYGIELITAEVLEIDVAHRRVKTSEVEIEFDYLVVAIGAQMDPGMIPGFSEATQTVYTLEGAVQARAALGSFGGGRVTILVSRLPYKCPAAPYETAFLVEALLRQGALRDRSTIDVYTPEPFPMPTAGEQVGCILQGMLTERDIGFHPGQKVERIDPATRDMNLEDGTVVPTDLLIGVPPHRAPDVIRDSALAGESGFVPVDRSSLSTSTEGIFAIGDITMIPIAGGKALPKAGVFAHAEAEVVARRLADELAARPATTTFHGTGACFVELGDGRAAYASGDFYAQDAPQVHMHNPGRRWHLAKVALEKYWLHRWL